jgi:hypothetical protein
MFLIMFALLLAANATAAPPLKADICFKQINDKQVRFGLVINGRCRLSGKVYNVPKHGSESNRRIK